MQLHRELYPLTIVFDACSSRWTLVRLRALVFELGVELFERCELRFDARVQLLSQISQHRASA
jgi:hypothetical protein